MRLILTQPALGHQSGDDNTETILAALTASGLSAQHDDILLLPERFHLAPERAAYIADLRRIAASAGCHVVGGSHHELRGSAHVNSGLVVAPSGDILGSYDKLRPYAQERNFVEPGTQLGEFEIGGVRVLVLVCADFWFSDLFDRASHLPDLVLVPALSVTRKPTPDYSRAMWRHLSIARAYEFGAFVGVSDWAHESRLPMLFASGVSGLADPTSIDPESMFSATRGAISAFDLDFERLALFRQDRLHRGFFWKKG